MKKPWGTETLLTTPDSPYCMKVLVIDRGHRLSLQAHSEKHETMHLAAGEAQMELGTEKFRMVAPRTVAIAPMVKHRVTALTRCVIYEASTPETGKTIRYEDDYGRADID